MIPFNKPLILGKELEYIRQAITANHISGDGAYTKACNDWLVDQTKATKVLLTTSCTHALEMAAILCKLKPGDEVIMPSFTYVSTANAFVLQGAKIVFVDIRPDTMNIDENLIEAAITEKTKVIVPVHYAGISCDMDKIMAIGRKYHLLVVEDAAHGMMAKYKGKALGSIGDLGCFSFHESKNYSMGEGGAILINHKKFCDRAEIIRKKGTNRNDFLCKKIDKYTWVDVGSSYSPSDINAAYLFAQLEEAQKINRRRQDLWRQYHDLLKPLADKKIIELPHVPDECEHNGHLFYIKLRDMTERDQLIHYLKEYGISSVFHYVPLHSSPAGFKFGRFNGEDHYTTSESDRLLRLPLFYDLSEEELMTVVEKIYEYSVKYHGK